MRRVLALSAILLATAAGAASRGEQWWAHVRVLAADDMKGRLTGSPDYLRAADYVVSRFEALGLQPAGAQGYLQPIAFVEQTISGAQTQAALTGGKSIVPIPVPGMMIVSGSGGPAPAMIDAPMVFAGYGLRIPEAGWNDFAGLDVRGKIVVVIAGGPATIAGALKSDARSRRAKWLADQGAVGILTLTPPGQVEIPWARRALIAAQPAMYFADPALRDMKTPFFSAAFDTARSDLLFEGSGHSFAELAALADAARPVPRFALSLRLKAKIAASRREVTSPNIVARLPGSDPALQSEHVIVSAHLDGLGVGEPIAGDRIYNGAMDDASGVATVLEIAEKLRRDGARPRRSILFLIVCGEEKGLLGSHYFAERPTVPRESIVADLNFDMPLPLWPLKNVIVLGADESSLGEAAAAVGAAQGLPLVPDPLPERNSFIRSDQYSFIRAGIPSVAFKFGFARGTREEAIERDWRSNRYHAPSDDVDQPVEKEEAVKLNDFVAALALRVADADSRPSWNATSRFKDNRRR